MLGQNGSAGNGEKPPLQIDTTPAAATAPGPAVPAQSPVSPALNYQRGESSRSGYSAGGSTISAYRPEDADRERSDPSREASQARERLPYSFGISGESNDAQPQEHGGHGENLFTGVHRKNLKRSGWISSPNRETQDEWVQERDEVTEWLPLFYGKCIAFAG